jgi:hypothetical protein
MTGVPLDVGAWSAQFGFIADAEDDRNRRCCGFGSERGPLSRRDDHGHLSTDQVSHQYRQAIVLAFQPVVLDRHVLALDVTGFVEAFPECGRKAHGGIRRSLSDKPDYRERGLRARHKRPRNDRTTHKAEKFPSPHRHAPDNRPTQTITSEVTGYAFWHRSLNTGRCLLWVKSRHAHRKKSCPLCLRKRTCAVH